MPTERLAFVGAVASFYLRRDATALGLILLSMLDITSSFHKDGFELLIHPEQWQKYHIALIGCQ